MNHHDMFAVGLQHQWSIHFTIENVDENHIELLNRNTIQHQEYCIATWRRLCTVYSEISYKIIQIIKKMW